MQAQRKHDDQGKEERRQGHGESGAGSNCCGACEWRNDQSYEVVLKAKPRKHVPHQTFYILFSDLVSDPFAFETWFIVLVCASREEGRHASAGEGHEGEGGESCGDEELGKGCGGEGERKVATQ